MPPIVIVQIATGRPEILAISPATPALVGRLLMALEVAHRIRNYHHWVIMHREHMNIDYNVY